MRLGQKNLAKGTIPTHLFCGSKKLALLFVGNGLPNQEHGQTQQRKASANEAGLLSLGSHQQQDT